MGAFFQKFVVAIFEKRRGVWVRICEDFKLSATANPTKKHGRVFTATQRCLQIADQYFSPMLCETFFVCIKVIYRLFPAGWAPGPGGRMAGGRLVLPCFSICNSLAIYMGFGVSFSSALTSMYFGDFNKMPDLVIISSTCSVRPKRSLSSLGISILPILSTSLIIPILSIIYLLWSITKYIFIISPSFHYRPYIISRIIIQLYWSKRI